MARIAAPSPLCNPIASPAQLQDTASRLDGVGFDLERSLWFACARLIQTAGVLLRLPQDQIASSIVVMQRFTTGPAGASFLDHDTPDLAAACLYLTTKPGAYPVSTRAVMTAVETAVGFSAASPPSRAEECRVSEAAYQQRKQVLYHIEARLLKTLSYNIHVALPHTLCVNYLQTLGALGSGSKAVGQQLARTALRHVNSALLSPQLLFLTHQPSAIATAAIYLAAKQTGCKLPDCAWWEVFDTDREELGFLVVAMLSITDFAVAEQEKWGDETPLPLAVDGLRDLVLASQTA